ncbi:MAG: hypothetical protein JNM76_17630 [Betaproteobacteria bacterium]|nr:hypothetical protein [Betaproteobacteria bacterium]
MPLSSSARVVSETDAHPDRSVAIIGATGVLCALVVLATSATLRLATSMESGSAVTQLAVAVENPVRLLHRVAAMAISGLSLWAFVVALRGRKHTRASKTRFQMAGTLLLLTIFLSILGPFTPGYRIDAITVGNVTGGVALVLVFQAWWMSGQAGSGPTAMRPTSAKLAMCVFAAQISLGALVSAQAMTQRFGWLLPHIGGAIVLIGCTVFWHMTSSESGLARRRLILGLVLMHVQAAGGIALALLAERPLGLAVAHAMLSPLIGMVLLGAWLARDGGLETLRDDA